MTEHPHQSNNDFPQGAASAEAGIARTADAAASRAPAGKGPHSSEQHPSRPPSGRDGFTIASRRSLGEVMQQIDADHREGRESVVLTRAMARALYFALWDTLYEPKPRDHEQADLERLQRLMSTAGSVGWPLGERDA